MKKDKITLYIEGVNQYLKNQYGEVKPEWGTTLMVLEDTLRRYEQIKEAINIMKEEIDKLIESNK